MSAERDYLIPHTDYVVRRRDIPTYFTEDNFAQIDMWNKWKQLGMPFTGGWAEQPAVFIDVISCLEAEYQKRQVVGNK